MKNLTRLAALALAVAAPLALAGTAQAYGGASISGVVWHDLDNDRVRDADEPGIAGHYMVIEGTDKVVQTDSQGRYSFKHLAAGSYTVKSTDRSLLAGQGWVPGGPNFRPDNGTSWMPVKLTAGQKVENFDSAFATARVDTKVWQLTISNPTPKVGDVIEIYGSTHLDGTVYDQFGGQLTLPDGLRVIERLGGMPKYYETEPEGKVTGYFYDRRSAPEWVGVRVVVEKPIDGEVRYEVMKGLFRGTDADTSNDTASKRLVTG
ncbi:hypothetical protein LFM09_27170 [Lentzea alba]|uniref:SdrD B-like domain-containing protein n=1 Tax=Lentzea alba TaxID=2714351 RepID=UPI0039BF2A33